MQDATSMTGSDCRLEKAVLPGHHQLELNEVYLLPEVCRRLRSGALWGQWQCCPALGSPRPVTMQVNM